MWVVVNAAVSVDGKLSSRRREQVRISGPDDFARVNRLRGLSDAVVVGIGTVVADDPHLTVDVEALPDWLGFTGQPVRVVVDSRARIPMDARVLDGAAETVVLVSESAPDDRVMALEAAGAGVIRRGTGRVDLCAGFGALAERGVERVMVEGGGTVIASLFEADLVDVLSVYVGSMVIGGETAPTLVDGPGFVEDYPRLSLESVARVDDGVLLQYARPRPG